jgi:subtilisin family serine protease
MKSNHYGALALGSVIAFFLSTITVGAASFVDPRLEAWNSTVNQGAIEEQRSVVVILKQRAYTDRSGALKSFAIASEAMEKSDFIRSEASRLLPLDQQNVLGGNSIDVLWSSHAFVTSITRRALKDLSQDPAVEAILEDAVITLDAPITPTNKNKTDESQMTYGLQKINVQAAWDQGINGEGVVVGVIDTGVDADHPDLKGKIIDSRNFTSDQDAFDGNGHGTHVSGTIAGGKASGAFIGVAPGAKILAAKALSNNGSGQLSWLLKAMEWMLDPDGNPLTDDAPSVVSNSWGSSSMFTYGFRNIVQTWRRFEVFPSFAAGNSGFFFTVGAPGSYPFSYAVAAVDENHQVTSFSSRGPVIEFKGVLPRFFTKPDIAAPGLNVLSSVPGGTWKRYSGTSMATPHISGVIALLYQINPQFTIAEIEEILNSTAMDRASKGKDNRYGHGVVQVDLAVERAKQWQTNDSVSFFQDKDPNQWVWGTP